MIQIDINLKKNKRIKKINLSENPLRDIDFMSLFNSIKVSNSKRNGPNPASKGEKCKLYSLVVVENVKLAKTDFIR